MKNDKICGRNRIIYFRIPSPIPGEQPDDYIRGILFLSHLPLAFSILYLPNVVAKALALDRRLQPSYWMIQFHFTFSCRSASEPSLSPWARAILKSLIACSFLPSL